jgi:hypothetical protein
MMLMHNNIYGSKHHFNAYPDFFQNEIAAKIITNQRCRPALE